MSPPAPASAPPPSHARGTTWHTLGGAVALGYTRDEAGVSSDYVNSGRFEIQVAERRYGARASLTPLYDPRNERIRA
jgi:sarcosine dehydrogenase